MDTLKTDLRQAVRTFRANPGLTAVAVLSLAIGIGPNSAIFSLVDAVGFRPLPLRDARHLVAVSSIDEHADRTSLIKSGGASYPEFLDVRSGVRSFSGVAASARQGLSVAGGRQPAALTFATLVSEDYFAVVGVSPMLGRVFVTDEERASGATPAAIISERLWRERFDANPGILGTRIRLNNTDAAVVGVMPAIFTGADAMVVVPVDVWIPFGLMRTLLPGDTAKINSRRDRNVSIFARLRDGVVLDQAGAEVQALGTHLAEAYPDTSRGRRLIAEYEETARRSGFARVMAFSLAVVGLVLLVACANVAGLLLGRAQARRREIAVRLALGASRWRLIRQLLTESAVLSIAGAALGLLLGFCLVRAIPGLIPQGPIPFVLDVRLDLRLTLFTLAACLVAVPVFGLTPALLASRPDVTPVMKGSEESRLPWRRISLRGMLVVGQVAIALAFVISSALLVRSYLNTRQIDPGFNPRPMAFATTVPQVAGYTEAQTDEFFARLTERLRATPGVDGVAIVRQMPLNALWGVGPRKVTVPGADPPRGQDTFAFRSNSVTPGYFDLMGMRRLKGRDFTPADRAGAACVAIVNKTMAGRFWPDGTVLGRHIVLPAEAASRAARDCSIVGVVQDAKYVQLTEAAQPYFYLPYAQAGGEATVIVRGGNEAMLAAALRREVTTLDRAVPITQVTVLSAHLETASFAERLTALLVSGIGAMGLFLSVIGLYGIVAFFVARRTREIGIRIALGARPADVVAGVLKQAWVFAGTGCAIGLALAVCAAQVMSSSLYGVSSLDPLVFLGGTTLVVGVAMAAALVPARRASRVDPNVALRCE